MKRVLLTGGTGFVGANLARKLLQDGHEVHLLVRPAHQSWRIDEIRPHCQIHSLELDDEFILSKTLSRLRPEWIFHLAAYGAYSWQNDYGEMVNTNIRGTSRLLESALRTGFEAFINTGSSSEYGLKDHPPAEREWLEPNSYYAVTKAAVTMYCRFMAQRFESPVVTLRLYSVYGPYEDPGRLIPTVILKGLDGKLPPLAHPDTARDYVYVSDACEAYLQAAAQANRLAGEVFNVGTGFQTSLRQMIEIAINALDLKQIPEWGTMPSRSWDTATWVADNQKIVSELGWQPGVGLEQGFRLTLDWFRSHPALLAYYQQQLREAAQ